MLIQIKQYIKTLVFNQFIKFLHVKKSLAIKENVGIIFSNRCGATLTINKENNGQTKVE